MVTGETEEERAPGFGVPFSKGTSVFAELPDSPWLFPWLEHVSAALPPTMCLSLQHPKRPPGNPQQLFLGYGMKITGSYAHARKTPFGLIYLPEEGATHMPSLS